MGDRPHTPQGGAGRPHTLLRMVRENYPAEDKRRRRSRLALLVVCVLIVLVGAFPASGLSAAKTTGPGSRLEVFVKITDSKILLALYGLSDYGGSRELYLIDWPNVRRGSVARFVVVNAATKPHNFVFLGKKTPTLKPGARSQFEVALLTRGVFTYKSTTGGKHLTGKFIVN